MAISTVIIDFNGPGNYALTPTASNVVNTLLMVSVTNLGGVEFDFADSDNTRLTGSIILPDLAQYSTVIGSVAVPLFATASGKGLTLRLKQGGLLTGFAVVDIT